MRKYISLAVVMFLLLPISLPIEFSVGVSPVDFTYNTCCDRAHDSDGDGDNDLSGCEPFVTDLIAGQHLGVGAVTVWVEDGSLHVEYSTSGGWLLVETHLYVGVDPPTKSASGQFPYKHEDLGGVTTDLYEIPLSELGVECGETLYIAAHAVVYEVVGDGCGSPQWATNVEDYDQGTLVGGGVITDSGRTDPNAALGSPDGLFYSLGFVSNDDGYLVVSFDHPVYNGPGDDIAVYEVTYGRDNYPTEAADVYVIVDGAEHYAGTVTNHDAPDGRGMVSIPDGLLYVDAVKLVDNTDPNDFPVPPFDNADGYDVEAVGACYLYHEETAWGDGEQFGEGWAMYFTYNICCDP